MLMLLASMTAVLRIIHRNLDRRPEPHNYVSFWEMVHRRGYTEAGMTIR